jgi:hypothetical protein
MRGLSEAHPPPPRPNKQFRLAPILVEGREVDSDEGPRRHSSPVSGDSKCHICTFSYLLLGNKPTSGSHIFPFCTHFACKEYKAKFQPKASKTKLFCSAVNACGLGI